MAYILGAPKNGLTEIVLLSTHNICFGWEFMLECVAQWSDESIPKQNLTGQRINKESFGYIFFTFNDYSIYIP